MTRESPTGFYEAPLLCNQLTPVLKAEPARPGGRRSHLSALVPGGTELQHGNLGGHSKPQHSVTRVLSVPTNETAETSSEKRIYQ